MDPLFPREGGAVCEGPGQGGKACRLARAVSESGVLTEHPEPGPLLKIVTVAFVFGTFARKGNLRRLESLVLECKHRGSESDLGGMSLSH